MYFLKEKKKSFYCSKVWANCTLYKDGAVWDQWNYAVASLTLHMTCFRGRSHQWRDFSSFVSCCRVKPAKEAILEKKPNHRRRNFLSHLQLKDYFNGTLQGSFDQSNSSTGLTTWPEEPTSMTMELCRGMVISRCWSMIRFTVRELCMIHPSKSKISE